MGKVATEETIKKILGAVNAINAKNVESFTDFKKLLGRGLAKDAFPVGSRIVDTFTYQDFKTTPETHSTNISWDIVHYTSDGGAYLKMHEALMPRDLGWKKGLYSPSTQLNSGTYYFTIGEGYGTFESGTNYQFTASKTIPAGSVLYAFSEPGETADIVGREYQFIFGDIETGRSIDDTITLVHGTEGTYLGTTNETSAYEPNGDFNAIAPWFINNYQDEWKISGIRAWLNTDDTTLNWWTRPNKWAWNNYLLYKKLYGFKTMCSTALLDVISPTTVISRNADGTHSTTNDLFFIPSSNELYYRDYHSYWDKEAQQTARWYVYDEQEGEPWEYYIDLAKENGYSEGFKQGAFGNSCSLLYPAKTIDMVENGTWYERMFLRSIDNYHNDNGTLFQTVTDDGYLSWHNEAEHFGVVCPCCKIMPD